jgi:radical SAM protein with 4Fe4S-binding SPASM domain
LAIHLSVDDSSILDYSVDIRPVLTSVMAFNRFVTNREAAHYLSLCDGSRSHDEIVTAIFGDTAGSIITSTLAEVILGGLEQAGWVTIRNSPLEVGHAIEVTGSLNGFHPLHLSYELSEGCNFRCDHCYISSGPELTGRLSGTEVKVLFDKFARQGVRVVEITGGECTIHPEFPEVLAHASSVFSLVAVMTNGYLLGTRKRIQDAVADAHNVAVQVSIDGLRETHDRFRKHEGAFDAAVNALKFCKSIGRVTRMACSVSPAQLDDVPGLFELAEEIGVDSVVFAPVSSFGRGCDLADTFDDKELLERLREKLAPFEDRPLSRRAAWINERAMETSHNCGAGWRSFAVNWKGDVRSCLFLADSKRFGNVRHMDWDELFNQPEMRLFHAAPRPGGAECKDCAHYFSCVGCFAKAFMIPKQSIQSALGRKSGLVA